MKTLHLTLEKEILIVEVPTDATKTYISGDFLIYNQGKSVKAQKLNGFTKEVCKATDVTEEIAEGFVHSWESVAKDGTKVFENYKAEVPKKRTALDSFKSAVESKGFYWGVNPYQLDWDELCEWGYVAIDGKTCSRSDRYEKAKEKTFNLKQTLIFEKI